jgi:hypothetical protein
MMKDGVCWTLKAEKLSLLDNFLSSPASILAQTAESRKCQSIPATNCLSPSLEYKSQNFPPAGKTLLSLKQRNLSLVGSSLILNHYTFSFLQSLSISTLVTHGVLNQMTL